MFMFNVCVFSAMYVVCLAFYMLCAYRTFVGNLIFIFSNNDDDYINDNTNSNNTNNDNDDNFSA